MSSLVTRIVFVHGSVGNAESTWAEQRSLEDLFECVFLTRSGYPPGPPLERIDFEEQADDVAAELRDGDHLVGHSYGAVVSLLAASAKADACVADGRASRLRSASPVATPRSRN